MNNPEILEKIVGKTVAHAEEYYKEGEAGKFYGDVSIVVTFTDGTIWKIESMDYQDYDTFYSSIDMEFIEKE